MSKVGIVPHALKPEAHDLVPKIVQWLEEHGHTACLLRADAEALGFSRCATDRETFPSLDLLVVLGGDGTMLHGIQLAGFAGVPVLGVNLGFLGFLTEVGPDDVFTALDAALSGSCSIDERSTATAEIVRPDGSVEGLGEAINEFSVERGVGGKVVQMTLTIGGQPFAGFGADGLIVATPTGSTAYAFSMRGPVVSPKLRSLVVVAVGAHALFDRPLVVADDQDVEVAVRFGGRGIVLADGKPHSEIGEGDVLRASVGSSIVRLVRLAPDSFFTRLARRFGVPSP
ncbi:MAG TPA: NAD(+)/NADH kinase [Actinomycetota bacterium]|jgi:NAD+ kinase|nr:NAD(+)/NADH kinase [Actinomycetota bacterium]